MKHGDEARFSQVMFALAEAFSQEASAFKIEIYFRALEDIDIADVESACWSIIRKRTTATFPKAAEIREAVEGSGEDKAVLAVDKIIRAIRSIGGYETVVFDDPVIHLLVRNYGGWIRLSDITMEEWKFVRRDLIREYQTYAKRELPDDVPVTLTGIHDQTNKETGYEIERPVRYVGDRAAALAWTGRVRQVGGQVKDLVRSIAGKVG